MPKRKIMGISMPIVVFIGVLFIGLSVISFLAGALGRSLFTSIDFPSWLLVDQPHPELPAEALFEIGGFTITNTIFCAWITITVLGLFFWAATRKMKIIPGRLQAAAEFIIGYLYNFCTDIAGDKYGRRFFPLVATIFLFVITNAFLSLLPGFGSIIVNNAHGESVHLLRGVNTDVNLPLALALISFVMVEYWGIQAVSFRKYMIKFFNFGPLLKGFKILFSGKVSEGLTALFDGAIRAFIGFIELVSEFVRVLSFTFRLFGNMTGGEILLLMMFFLAPFLLVLPFYGLELLVGYIQALIFGGLTLVFATIAVTPHEEEEH